MAGTPTGSPEQDTPAGQRADTDAMAWERPVPTRWAPDPQTVMQSVPANPTVMRTAPGEGPVSR